MQRVSVVIVVALAGVLTFLSVGCVDQARYEAVLMRNREQEKLLQEKEAQLAALNERASALQANQANVQRVIQEKDDHLASIMKERDEYQVAFKKLMDAYKKLSDRPVNVREGGIPTEVDIAIKKLAADYPQVFQYDEATQTLRFAADITFDSGSNLVKPDARTAITKLGGILASDVAKGVKVSIVGHTDRDPVKKENTVKLLKELNKPVNNQGLSEARAESVADILKAAGVEQTRMTTQGKGEAQPLDPGVGAEAKARNRRVEIFLRM